MTYELHRLEGGNDGAAGQNFLIRAEDVERVLNFGGKNSTFVQPGDRIRIETPGGGGMFVCIYGRTALICFLPKVGESRTRRMLILGQKDRDILLQTLWRWMFRMLRELGRFTSIMRTSTLPKGWYGKGEQSYHASHRM